MGLEPKMPKQNKTFFTKTCLKCGNLLPPESFVRTRSIFFPDGHTSICADCIESALSQEEYSWDAIDKFCQYIDVPFIPNEFVKLKETNGTKIFHLYAMMFLNAPYERLDWGMYYRKFKELEEDGSIEDELPGIREEKMKKLKEKWGFNYVDEDLFYLEDLYDGILASQTVNGALSDDQAKKLCKISLVIDSRIRDGADIDKMLTSYDKLVKIADFTPKNAKNAADFDSVGEVFRWLEKRGWVNRYYDDVTHDIVDETIKNIQNFNQNLYVNETGIAEDIEKRASALQQASELEDFYGIEKSSDDTLSEYDIEGYNDLFKDEDFSAEV